MFAPATHPKQNRVLFFSERKKKRFLHLCAVNKFQPQFLEWYKLNWHYVFCQRHQNQSSVERMIRHDRDRRLSPSRLKILRSTLGHSYWPPCLLL